MTRHVALLRGINVGGKGLIKMDVLRAIFAGAGARDVSTYIASGNVMFDAPMSALPGIKKKVHAKLLRAVGPSAATVYRAASELHAIVDSDPFKKFRTADDVHRYVLFFGAKPKVTLKVPHWAERECCDVFAMRGLHVFVVSYRKETGWFGFPNNYVEERMDVVSTARTWNTVAKLAALTR